MAILDFEYYLAPDGTNHKNLFERQINDKCPEYLDNLQDVITNGVEITREEFYTYGIFEDYNPLNPGFSSFREFREIAQERVREFDRIFSIDGTIKFKYTGNTVQQICYAGCGGTLMTANKIFGLNDSDYIRIPEKKGRRKKDAVPGENKTLDFEYLYSNGERFFRVECKGMQGIDGYYNDKAKDIIAKKGAQPSGAGDISFGIITQIPVAPDSRNAKCVLVDPEAPEIDFSPYDFLFYSKVRFYTSRLSNLAYPGWLRQIKEYIISEDLELNQGVDTFPYFSINRINDPKIKFRDYFGISLIQLSPFFRIISIIDIYGTKINATLIDIKDNKFFLYGITKRFINTLNYNTLEDFINFKEESKEMKYSGEISFYNYYKEIETLYLQGNISILSTGEVVGNLNKQN